MANSWLQKVGYLAFGMSHCYIPLAITYFFLKKKKFGSGVVIETWSFCVVLLGQIFIPHTSLASN